MNIGVAIVLVAMILTWIAAAMGVTESSYNSEIDPAKVALKSLLFLIASGSFSLGIVLWLAGYIVKAISFLPGRLNVED